MLKRAGAAGPLRLLTFVFFASGASSLMYQVAWQRLLTLHYGVGAVSVTLIVSVYMLGLGFGALLGGLLAERLRKRILAYCIVELLMGGFGVASLPFLAFLGRATAGGGYGWALASMALFLVFPTFLMGMTLPLLTKIYNAAVRDFLRTVSLLYFVNTLGAAVGCLAAGYGFISFKGLDAAVYAAAAVNFILAALIAGAGYSPRTGASGPENTGAFTAAKGGGLGRYAYLLAVFTGFLAIGYEIVWFRVVGVLVKASPYAFSTALSVYLLGIALGSLWMNLRMARRPSSAPGRDLFFLFQAMIAAYVLASVAGYDVLTRRTGLAALTVQSFAAVLHPDWTPPSTASPAVFLWDVYRWLDVFLWPALFMFVPALLMGASFPLLASLAPSSGRREASTVGRVYFHNICGNVLGGLVTGFVLLSAWGTERTLLVFVCTGLCLGVFAARPFGMRAPLPFRAFAACLLGAAGLLWFPGTGRLYETMHTPPWQGAASILGEGVEGVVMTFHQGERVRSYINGLAHGGRPGYGFYYETLEAMSYAPAVENALVIGYGTGSVVETALKSDTLCRLTLVELSRTLIRNLVGIPVFDRMLSDPRISLLYDDGRRFLLRDGESYDLILIDPLRTTTAYSNNLYSRQFFQLVRARLKPGGVFMVWTDEYRVMPATVLSAFPYVRMYNAFCLASDRPFRRNSDRYDTLLAGFPPEIRPMVQGSGRFVGDENHIRKETAGYPVNEDWKPVCEYYLGLNVKEKMGWYRNK